MTRNESKASPLPDGQSSADDAVTCQRSWPQIFEEQFPDEFGHSGWLVFGMVGIAGLRLLASPLAA
jgi:hypothetical protein